MDEKPARNPISSAGAVIAEHTIPRKSVARPAALERRPREGIMLG